MNNHWQWCCLAVLVSVFSCRICVGHEVGLGSHSVLLLDYRAGWSVVEQNDQMLVLSKTAPNGRTRYRVEMKVRGNLTSLVSLLRDVGRRPSWDRRLKSAAELDSTSQAGQMIHIVLNAPWPEVDREMVVQEQWRQDPESFAVYFEQSLISDYIQPNTRRSPVEYWEAEWRLKSLGRRMVQVNAEIELGWGDQPPRWEAKYFGKNSFMNMMLAFSRESIVVYDDTRLAFVSDPHHYVPRLQRKPVFESSSAAMVVKR